MLRAGVNLNHLANPIQTNLKLKVGDNFDVVVTIWDDGEGHSPAVFDTFISEIWYNDQGIVVELDLSKPPLAGDLAANSPTTVDAFSLGRVFKDALNEGGDGVLERGTPLKRLDPTIEPGGSRSSANDLWRAGGVLQPGYKEASGRAGLSDFQQPFKLSPGQGMIAAVKGRASTRKDAHAVQPGETSMIAVCQAFLGSRPVPVISDVSTILIEG